MLNRLGLVRCQLGEAAAGFAPDELDSHAAVEVTRVLGDIRRLTDALIALVAARVDATAAHLNTGERNPAETVARLVGIETSEAKRAIDTARKLAQFPATQAKMRAGKLSTKQTELILNTADANPAAETELLAAAEQGLIPLRDACIKARAAVETGEERAKRHHQLRSLTMWTDSDGMTAGRFRLTPEHGGKVRALIDAAVRKIFLDHRNSHQPEPHDAYAADALCDLLLTGTGGGVNATVHIIIDHNALVRGDTLAGERCDIAGTGPVNVQWVRGILGDAFVTALIRKGRDITTVAHFGRHIPTELRTALLASGRECAIHGCHARNYLEIDHTVEFAKGGPTAWWNLEWICSIHHKRKTSGWNLGPPHPETGKRKLTPPDEPRQTTADQSQAP